MLLGSNEAYVKRHVKKYFSAAIILRRSATLTHTYVNMIAITQEYAKIVILLLACTCLLSDMNQWLNSVVLLAAGHALCYSKSLDVCLSVSE